MFKVRLEKVKWGGGFFWRRPVLLAVTSLFSTFLSACGSSSGQLFIAPCDKADPNCRGTALNLSTQGAKSNLQQETIEHGATTSALSVRAIRKDEKSVLTFKIANARLTPLRDFRLILSPGTGFAIDTSASTDCSKTLVLIYARSCTVTVSYTPGTPPPNQTAYFQFKTLLGETVEFSSPIRDARILSDFYIAGPTSSNDELVYSPSSTGFSESTLTVRNEGSTDDILDLQFVISGAAADDFLIVGGGAGACTTGQTLAANGASCAVKIRYKPLLSGQRRATLTFTGAGGLSRNYSLGGTVLQAQASTSLLSFGSQPLTGPSVTRVLHFNAPESRGNPSLGLCSYGLTGDSAFAITNNTCGASIPASSGCDVTIRYTPTSTSSFHSGSVTLNCNDRGGKLEIPLSAQTNAGPLATSVSSVDFGSVLVGGSATQTITFTNNSGSTSLSQFTQALTELAGSGLSILESDCVSSLPIGATCSVTLKYSPVSGGSTTAVFTAGSAEDQLDFGVVVQGLALAPQTSQPSVDFGTLLPDLDRIGETIHLTNPSVSETMSNCRLDTAAALAAGFSVDELSTCLSTSSLPPGGSCSLRPRFAANLPVGVRASQITFGCAVGGMARLLLSGVVATDSRLVFQSPTTFDFQERLVGSSTDAVFQLKNEHPGEVASPLAVTTPGIAAPWTRVVDGATDCINSSALHPNSLCSVRLRYAPSALPGAEQTGMSGGIVTAAAGPTSPIDPVYSGSALKLLPSSTSFAFGTVSTGVATGVATFTVQNPSKVDSATGCSAQVSSPFVFASQTCGTTLAPEKSCSYSVRLPSQVSSMTLNGAVTMTCTVGGRASTSLSATVIKPAGLSWSGSANFGVVDIGSHQDATFSLTHTGVLGDASTTTLLVGLSSAPAFSILSNSCPAILNPGATCTVAVRFAPTAATASSANLMATEASGNQTLALTGTGLDANLRIVPGVTVFSIDGHLVGSTTHQLVNLSNNASFGPATGLMKTLSPASAAWSLTTAANPCGSSLNMGANCNVQLTYHPVSAGATSGSLIIKGDDIGTDKTVAYSATALEITSSQTFIDFGVTDLNAPPKTSPTVITVKNPSSLDSASGCSASVAPPFAITNNTCGSTVAASGTCQFQVQLQSVASPATSDVQAAFTCAVGGRRSGSRSSQHLRYSKSRLERSFASGFRPGRH